MNRDVGTRIDGSGNQRYDMFNDNFGKRLTVIACLTVVIGCTGNDSDSTARRNKTRNGQSTMQGVGNDLIATAKKDDKSIYLPAVPELPEFTWRDIRVFNLPLNNPPIVPPAKADFLRGEDIVLGVILGDEARAYPWNLLANFHAVNDYLDGEPIIVNLWALDFESDRISLPQPR
jgi:hypothetical protein